MRIAWIGLYLSFHLSWVLGPFVHGRLQNLQTSEVTFAHVITLLIEISYGVMPYSESKRVRLRNRFINVLHVTVIQIAISATKSLGKK